MMDRRLPAGQLLSDRVIRPDRVSIIIHRGSVYYAGLDGTVLVVDCVSHIMWTISDDMFTKWHQAGAVKAIRRRTPRVAAA